MASRFDKRIARIVEEAGGHIAIEDTPEGGALFRAWLPAVAEE